MSEEITVVAEPRAAGSSNAARRLRSTGILPGSLSRSDGSASSIQLNAHDFDLLLVRHGDSAIIDLDLDGKKVKALINNVQVDPVTDALVHVDFYEIDMTKTIHLEIPIELVGEAPGVNKGGSLSQMIREIEIECLPSDLPDALEVDISKLEIDDGIYVKDISLGDKVEIHTGEDVLIVSVAPPRVLAKKEDEEEGEGEGEGEEAAAEGEGEDAGGEEASEDADES